MSSIALGGNRSNDESLAIAAGGRPSGTGGPGEATRDRGFALLVTLLVMALLAVLAFTLQFSADTERNISRNFAGQIQANYAGEGAVDAMVQALLLDLQYDSVGGWANRYLVVCPLADDNGNTCLAEYGFDPKKTVCYNTDPDKSCVYQDDDGTLTGVKGQWVADLTYRCLPVVDPDDPAPCPERSTNFGNAGSPPTPNGPTFPGAVPVRLDRSFRERKNDSEKKPPVMPWWEKLNDNLQTGAADLAIMSICESDCTGTPVWDDRKVVVTGIGLSEKNLTGQITRSRRPATRATSIRVRGDIFSVWGNALVGGSGDGDGDGTGRGSSSTDPIIGGRYAIRGSTLMFNDDGTKWVLTFPDADTGIVNNWYDTTEDTSVPPIASWWWSAARGCGTANCDANNSSLPNSPGLNLAHDSDGTAATMTIEAIMHHLPDPPTGGRRVDAVEPYGSSNVPYSSDYPGPEGLEAEMRLKRGQINFGSGAIGREEPSGVLGNFWNNVLNIFTDEDPTGAMWREEGGTYNVGTKTGAFDVTEDRFKFPSLNDPYVEPITRVQYDDYHQFLRGTDAKPGGWALDFTAIDGTTGVGRTVSDLGGGSKWPRAGVPTEAEVETNLAGGTFGPGCINPLVLESYNCTMLDAGANVRRCGNTAFDPNLYDYCEIHYTCTDAGTGSCTMAREVRIPVRQAVTVAADANLNLDTSSSLDAPYGRGPTTMRDSFAYKLYVDVIDAIDSADATQSTLYNNNLVGMPTAFRKKIPDVYDGATGTETTCQLSNGYPPCFRERWAYMDVHIQLPDAGMGNQSYDLWDNNSNALLDGSDADEAADKLSWAPSGRWLSVRFRPGDLIGSSDAAMTILNDPRARDLDPGTVGNARSCAYNPVSDIPAEVWEGPEVDGESNTTDGLDNDSDDLIDEKLGYFRPIAGLGWDAIGIPAGYDRARPQWSEDRMPRNMPTGAFVVALHLPCSDDIDDANPYKCTESSAPGYAQPSVAYDGFYTHIMAWAPKYTCWRNTTLSWMGRSDGSSGTTGPPTPAPNQVTQSGSIVCPVPTYDWNGDGVNDTTIGDPHDMGIAWFAESLYMANQTTLGDPSDMMPNGTEDTPSDDSTSDAAPLLGFKINVPFTVQAEPATQDPYGRDCLMGLDRRVDGGNEKCAGTAPPWYFLTCGINFDGIPCNGSPCASSGCAGVTPCTPEPDLVKITPNNNISYGGCNEIFTPLVTAPINPRITGLDPEVTPFARVGTDLERQECQPLAGFADGEVCLIDKGQQHVCTFPGVDPDEIGTWAVHRYGRGWPGWSSVNILETAGLIMTEDEIRFGAPQKGGSATYNSVTNALQGYYSDPIVYDGRAIIWAGPAATSNTTEVYFHDHVVPRGTMGCGDFLTVLANGNTEIDMQMQTSGKQLLAMYSLTENDLKVTTTDTDIQHELAGSWIANSANLGAGASYVTPVQLIGAPAIDQTACDHVYLPGRERIPQRKYLSFVEDATLPPGF